MLSWISLQQATNEVTKCESKLFIKGMYIEFKVNHFYTKLDQKNSLLQVH